MADIYRPTTSSAVHFKRKDCLKEIFDDARKKTCFFRRIEQKDKMKVQKVMNDIFHFFPKVDAEGKFQRKFHLKVVDVKEFQLFCEITLAEKHPSMYLHKVTTSTTKVGVQAESKILWKDESNTQGNVSFLNAHAVNVLLHVKLSKALKKYSRSDLWKERMNDINLNSVGLEEIGKLHIYVNKQLDDVCSKLTVSVIPCIRVHEYCLNYAQQWFGVNVSHFIAKPRKNLTLDPSLQWTASYHEHEFVALTTFPTKITLESLYGILVFVRSDSTLKMLSRDMILHIFLETTSHMSRWLEMNFERNDNMKSHDHDALMDNFFRNLRQRLECSFIPNKFNPEINLLASCHLDEHQIKLIINKLRAILRGSCECCRAALHEKINNLNSGKVNKRSKSAKSRL